MIESCLGRRPRLGFGNHWDIHTGISGRRRLLEQRRRGESGVTPVLSALSIPAETRLDVHLRCGLRCRRCFFAGANIPAPLLARPTSRFHGNEGQLLANELRVEAALPTRRTFASIKVSPEVMLSSLGIMDKDRAHRKHWGKVMEFVRKSGSFVQVEIEAEKRMIQEAASDLDALSGADAGLMLYIKSRVVPSCNTCDEPGVESIPGTEFATNLNLPPLRSPRDDPGNDADAVPGHKD
ncbi:hypothetical protein HU200_033489 [Digitaria exilis]|uniref:Uncharacterized protein n=1 Tax=Digitaria exilis TaxID=1010633 RepID=A0A835EPL5_9POAL|nr:hypothetical protein HU200_033489 [Digitaria exilis]